MLDVSQLKKGLKIKFDNQPHLITDFSFMKPGKGQAVYRCKLKNMISGNTFDKSWRSGDKFEKASLSSVKLIYSYNDGQEYIFIDEETYEQTSIDESILGDLRYFLIEDSECEILFFEEKPLEVSLPNFIEKEIVESEPGVRGDTATNVTKPATIDTGFELQVPIFINEGDVIKIDTRTKSYVERVKKK